MGYIMRFTHAGFSFPAVMMATAAIGGMVWVLMSLDKQKSQIQNKVKTHFEIENISQNILHTLFDGRACTYTLGHGSKIANGRKVPSIKNSNGTIIFNTAKKYGNQSLMLESFTLDKANIATRSDSTVNLKVVFKKFGPTRKGHDTITKSFPLTLELGPSMELVRCYSNHQRVMNLVTGNSCSQVGGSFHPETGKCIPAALSIASRNVCKGIGGTPTGIRCDLRDMQLQTLRSMCRNLGGNYQPSVRECVLPTSR